MRIRGWLSEQISVWLAKERAPPFSPLCDVKRMSYELRPGDVLLVEGRSRISDVIKLITQSPWTHAALYIGRLVDIRDDPTRETVAGLRHCDVGEQLLVEALIDQGTVLSPLAKYRDDHLRICRPAGLSPDDAQRVISYAVRRLGSGYNVRHMLDLARFLFPWSILPRRWRSSLFQHKAGDSTRTVCSALLAEAFNAVDFPILPFIDRRSDGSIRFFKRNPRLFAPRDFDYSPYFHIIKYPFLGVDDLALYRKLPWDRTQVVYNDEATFSPQLVDSTADAQPTAAAQGSARLRLVAEVAEWPKEPSQ